MKHMNRNKGKKRSSAEDLTILNARRAIYISGEIDGALLATVTPEIVSLRHDSTEPISVLIDSPGGSVAANRG